MYSNILEKELKFAPEKIKLVASKKLMTAEYIKMNEEMTELAELYIEEGALTKKSINDAQHIAIATIAEVNALVSWNFKHMVNFMRIKQYDDINSRKGYNTLRIDTPILITYINTI